MKKNICDGNRVFWAGAVICLAMFAATAAAAPVGKTRVNKTVLDPVASKPVWASSVTPRVDPLLIAAFENAKVTASGGPLVIVPPRPQPRSPFMPPLFNPGNLPPWAVLN